MAENELDFSNINYFLSKVPADFDPEAMQSAIDKLITYHPVLGSRAIWSDPWWHVTTAGVEANQFALNYLGEFSHPSNIQLPVDEVTRALHSPFRPSSSASSSPLFRAFWLRGASGPMFGLTIHHCVSDGTSLSIIKHDLSAIYTSLVAGASLPDVGGLSYFDHVTSLEDWHGSEAGQLATSIWRKAIHEYDPILVPFDGAHPNDPGEQISLRATGKRSALTSALQFQSQMRVSLFSFFLSGLIESCVNLGSPGRGLIRVVHSGRDDPQLVRSVGCFTHDCPLVLDMQPSLPRERYCRHISSILPGFIAAATPHAIDDLTGYKSCLSFNFINAKVERLPRRLFIEDVQLQDPEWSACGSLPAGLAVYIGQEEFFIQLDYWSGFYKEQTMRRLLSSFLENVCVSAESAPIRLRPKLSGA